jgi:hypothetical protein
MEAWKLIQDCEVAPFTGVYNKIQFLNAISEMKPDEFNRFCKTFLHLSFFHASHQGAWATDDADLINANPKLFWKIERLDFDAPINFKRVR